MSLFITRNRYALNLTETAEFFLYLCTVFVYSSSRNDVPRVAQRYGTTAAHTRPRCVCSVLRAHVQFCRLDKADATADVQ